MVMNLLRTFPLLTVMALGSPSLTIYNKNFAVVRQQVPMTLQEGSSKVSFDQVTATLEPDSVVLRDPSGTLQFDILEQSYRNDPVSESLLLHHFEGQEIPFLITPKNGEPYEEPAKIIRSGYVKGATPQQPIIELNEQLRFSLPGQPLFPSLGEDSILRPTLSWTLNSTPGSGMAELSYLTSGLSWKADYNLVVTQGAPHSTLNGWVTLSNQSGTRFDQAEIKLLAGDINRVSPPQSLRAFADAPSVMSKTLRKEKTVAHKELDSYHLYEIERPVTLRDRETKQVQFTESHQVLASKDFVYAPTKTMQFWGHLNKNNHRHQQYSNDVSIYWNFQNNKENGLGIPLPAGKIRLYQNDENQLEFLGENTIDHTPQKERISFYTGNAFDLIGERQVLDFKSRDNSITEKIKVTLRNRSKNTVTIKAEENLYRWNEWKIISSSAEYQQLNSHLIQFSKTLQPDEETNITYTVQYHWK